MVETVENGSADVKVEQPEVHSTTNENGEQPTPVEQPPEVSNFTNFYKFNYVSVNFVCSWLL